MRLHCASLAVLMVWFSGTTTAASAAPITGSFAISGAFTYDTLNTSGGAGLAFQVTLPPTSPSGPFIAVTPATGYFADLGFTPLVTDRKSTRLNSSHVRIS